RQHFRCAVVALLQSRQGVLVMAGAVLGHAEGGLITAIFAVALASRLGLAESIAILERIEERLAEEGPAGLVIALRISLLAVAVHQRQSQLLRLGPHGR